MKSEQAIDAARRMELPHQKSQTFWLTCSICCVLQMAFSEHNVDDEDGNGTGLIIRDITDTLENATDGLLAVAHTSGRARWV